MIDIYDTFLPSGELYKTIYINMYGEKESKVVPKGFNTIHIESTTDSLTAKLKSRKVISKIRALRKSQVIIGVIATLILIIGCSVVGVVIHRSNENKQIYKTLTNAMLSIDENYSGSEDTYIQSLIDRLPYDYKDVEEIKKQYKKINWQVDIIKSIEVSALTNDESKKLRDAIENLYELDDEYTNWDLSDYLKYNLLFEHTAQIAFGKKWETGNYYFYWFEDSTGEHLRTNLPSNAKQNEEYYFDRTMKDNKIWEMVLPSKFQYINKNDIGDYFDAYAIESVCYQDNCFKLKIYCYVNGRYYTLE
jgi:hypothetical protein